MKNRYLKLGYLNILFTFEPPFYGFIINFIYLLQI